MKKKLLSLLLSTAMIAALLSGCGSASDTSASASADTGASTDTAAEASTDSAAAPGEEDNVIKIGAICAMTGALPSTERAPKTLLTLQWKKSIPVAANTRLKS